MSLHFDIIDDFIDGKIGNEKVITRQEVNNRYKGKYCDGYLAAIYNHSRFFIRVGKGMYRIDQRIINRRKKERESE